MGSIIFISPCLLGVRCSYSGKAGVSEKALQAISKWEGHFSACPEILSGFSVPRPRMEISGGDGYDVITGNAEIVDEFGKDRTEKVLSGASKVVKIILKNKIESAFLREKSPLCGVNKIYDGTFSKNLKSGCGVLTALLRQHRIECIPVKTREKFQNEK